MHVLITGATGGIGTAATETFLTESDSTTVTAWARDADGLESLTRAHNGTSRLQTQVVDVRDQAAVFDAGDAITTPVDVVIPLAAIAPGTPGETPLPTVEHETVQETLETNVTGVLTTVRAVAETLAPDGRILVPSGTVAREPKAGMGAYGVSKAAVEGLARGLAVDCEQHVGVVDPGLVATDLSGSGGRSPAQVAPMFHWAATDAEAAELDGDILTLRDWKLATR